MNYLETGLPHTQLFPKKTQFSPPRFIPLCTLGRKYLGLEPLTRREFEELISRLSGPKKPATDNEEQTNALTQVRPRTTSGTRRFVGQKKMSMLQIDRMVERLYSGRPLKENDPDDESVTGEDILNMTNRLDDSSDSEIEPNGEQEPNYQKDRKDQHNCQIRHLSSTIAKSENERDSVFRRNSMMTPVKKDSMKPKINKTAVDFQPSDIPKLKLDSKPRLSVSFSRDTALLENRMKASNGPDKGIRRSNTVCSYIAIRPDMKKSQSLPSYASYKIDTVKLSKDELEDEPAKRINSGTGRPKWYIEPELTRPPPSRSDLQTSNDVTNDDITPGTPESNSVTRAQGLPNSAEKTQTPRSPRKSGAKSELNNSPRSKFPKIAENITPRYAVTNCDELLIDRVATYNRSPRVRNK